MQRQVCRLFPDEVRKGHGGLAANAREYFVRERQIRANRRRDSPHLRGAAGEAAALSPVSGGFEEPRREGDALLQQRLRRFGWTRRRRDIEQQHPLRGGGLLGVFGHQTAQSSRRFPVDAMIRITADIIANGADQRSVGF
ncbi:hypothetical protein D3C86_1610350 [compost metagenome]